MILNLVETSASCPPVPIKTGRFLQTVFGNSRRPRTIPPHHPHTSRATRYNTSIVASPFSLVKRKTRKIQFFFSLFFPGFLFCFSPVPPFSPGTEQKGRLNEENKTEGGKKNGTHDTQKSFVYALGDVLQRRTGVSRFKTFPPLRPPRPTTPPIVPRTPDFSPYRRRSARFGPLHRTHFILAAASQLNRSGPKRNLSGSRTAERATSIHYPGENIQ